MKSVILTNLQINQKIKRIAYQIYENNVTTKELVIAGIADNGFILAKRIKTELESISDIKINLCEVTIDKNNPLKKISTSIAASFYTNKSLVLVDDVLNSGTTLMYAVKHFLNVPLKQFKTAVLVNRNHKKYPVKADFKGLSLSTTLKEHIKVEFSNKNVCAYLE